MKNSSVIEQKLGIILPKAYRELINNRPNICNDVFYFPDSVIERNIAYSWDLDNYIDSIDEGVLARIKRIVFEGSLEQILTRKREWVSQWVETNFFVIGSDGGEEEYYIHLGDSECKVFAYDIESNKSYLKFSNIDEYIEAMELHETESRI